MKPMAPLNAMRAFEAAARTGSFTNAARELGVSSPAVSQQVKLLEDYWNETLFIRQGNRISLTGAGQIAYPQIAQAITAMTEVSDRMQRRTQRIRRFSLSASQSVAETWLAPRLAGLGLLAAKAGLSIRVDEDPIDFVRDKVDMRIFFGHDLYGDYQVETLFADSLVAVAAPQFIVDHGRSLVTLPDKLFIHTDWGRGFASSPDWTTALLGLRQIDRDVGWQVESSSAAIKFAKHGAGVALVPRMMAADDLSSNRIALMEFEPTILAQEYRLAYPKRLQSNAQIQQIIRALKSASDSSS